MRPLAVFVVMCAPSAAAQPNSQPLQELPPPEISGPDEPAVQNPGQKEDRVEEVREGGRLVMLQVTPPGGRSSFLVSQTATRTSIGPYPPRPSSPDPRLPHPPITH